MPLMAKESNLYYEGCIGGKTGNTNDAGHTLVAAAERNGRTYIAVTLRAPDLGANCTDTIALFDYAFNNFDTLTLNGKNMTVPKGVTLDDLSVKTKEKNGQIMNQFYYSNQFVGYVMTPKFSPTPQVTQPASAEDAAQSGNVSAADVLSEDESNLSSTSKFLLGIMAVMAVILVILMTALHFKEKKMYRSRR